MSKINVETVPETTDRSLSIFGEFDKVAEQIRMQAYNLFSRRGAGDGYALDDWLAAEREVCWPAAELVELDEQYSLKVTLAGFEPNEISITATPQEIMVKAAHEHARSGDEGHLRWSEFRSSDVYRHVELPSSVNVDKITANLKNGLLEITAPKVKAKGESERKIELSTPS